MYKNSISTDFKQTQCNLSLTIAQPDRGKFIASVHLHTSTVSNFITLQCQYTEQKCHDINNTPRIRKLAYVRKTKRVAPIYIYTM